MALLHKSLLKHGLNAGALHGDMEQSERTATLDKFRRNEISLLVCSDVAARGLDIDAVSHVFNFDVPFHAEDYVHRIGRTGRAGLNGAAYTLVTPDDLKQVAAIEHLIKKTIDRETVEGLGEPHEEEPRHRSGGRPGNSRGSSSSDRPRGPSRDNHSRDSRPPRDSGRRPPRDEAPAAPPPRPQPAAAPQAPQPATSSPGEDRFDSDLPAFLRRPAAPVKSKG